MFGFKPIWFYEVNLTDELTAANATIATDAEAAARWRAAVSAILSAFSEAGAAAWIAAVNKAVQPGRGLRHAGSGEAHAARRRESSLHPLARVCAMHWGCA